MLYDIDKWNNIPSKILISEVGWPSGGGRIGGSFAGMDELQLLLNDWVCSEEGTDNIGWYWFEAFDEPWKSIYHNGDDKWETQWGLFTSNRMLKDGIKLPDCEKLKAKKLEEEKQQKLRQQKGTKIVIIQKNNNDNLSDKEE